MTDDPSLLVNLYAERAILGAILLDNSLLLGVTNKLRPEHFSLDSHRRIFRHCLDMQQAGTAIDPLMLTEVLNRSKELEAVGGVAYVGSLTDGLTSRLARLLNIEEYAAIVRDKALSRAIIHACESAIAATRMQDEAGTNYLEYLERDLLALREDAGDGQMLHGADFFRELMAEIEKKRQSPDAIHGLETGIASLDKLTGGIEESEIWIVGGRPGSGKTALAVQGTVVNCKSAKRVGVFSLEMKGRQFMRRVAAQVAKIPGFKLKFPQLLDAQELELLTRTEEFIRRNWSLWVDESSCLTTTQLISRAIVAAKRHKLDLLVIDHLGKMRGQGRNIEERSSDVVDAVTQFAKDYCRVLALSQLARPNDHNICERPNMTELRGSGMIEANAHTVLLVHRGRDRQTKQLTGEDEIIIDKQREGEPGIEPVTFDKDLLLFRPREMRRG